MTVKPFKIARREVGGNAPCLVIGEVAQAHDGSLGMAHAFIDAVADSGAGAVKFQTHIASAESSVHEPFRVKFSDQDATRFDYWRRMEFTEEQWLGLAEHARRRGLIFLSSPFSEEAVELLKRVGVPAWKIASGEVNNPLLLEQIAASKLPVLLSTGMSSLAEIDRCVEWIKACGLPLAVFQCTSRYPSPPEEVGLNMLDVFRERYAVPVGLSDHSGTIYASLAAVALGASLIEVHVTFNRGMFGPDVPVSLNMAELRQLVEGTRFVETAVTHPVDKDSLAAGMQGIRAVFGKALVARRKLAAGHRLEVVDMTARKPASRGIPVERLTTVIGRVLKVDRAAGDFIKEDDLTDEKT